MLISIALTLLAFGPLAWLAHLEVPRVPRPRLRSSLPLRFSPPELHSKRATARVPAPVWTILCGWLRSAGAASAA